MAGLRARQSPIRRYLGTFHKTGTVMVQSILEAADAQGILPVWIRYRDPEPAFWALAFDQHGDALPGLDPQDRAAVVLRDPRDVIISATHYHLRACEPWLLAPKPEFGGRSYRDALRSEPDLEHRILFEMAHASGDNIARQVALARDRPEIGVFRYEDLAWDRGLTELRRLLAHLKLADPVTQAILRIAPAHLPGFAAVEQGVHHRDGRAAQWRAVFTPAHHAEFAARFPDALEILGYAS
ncbi:MAG: hypothetical protein AAF914_03720 [Pseudomonadota bacterium]